MKKLFLVLASLLSFNVFAQNDFYQMLDKLLKDIDAPTIKVSELKDHKNIIYLDARTKAEFHTSHLRKAFHVGENGEKYIPKIKDSYIVVVYCSVGYRSGKVAEKLKAKGYNVYNLYGGIFEWVHAGKEIVDLSYKKTQKVHTYNKEWSKWLRKGEKVY